MFFHRSSRIYKIFKFRTNILYRSHLPIRQNVFKSFCKTNNSRPFVTLAIALNIFGFYDDEAEPERKYRYWVLENIADVLEEADRLYSEENCLEAYELLNRLKYHDNVEVHWRICRILFKMSQDLNQSKVIRENMVKEAYQLIKKTLQLTDNHAEVHKWMAIFLDLKTSQEGILSHVQSASDVKRHLEKSLELNPEDHTVLYMLGRWCYELSQLTWIQRQIAKTLFDCPPETNLEEAYLYFLRAEQVKPRFFLGNVYMLGLCSYDLGLHFKARYYLDLASHFPVRTETENVHSVNAKKLSEKLKNYEFSIESLCV